MPVSVAPLAAPSASVAAPDPRSPRAGDPVCVAFTQAAGPFRHAGTRILDLDLAPLLAASARGGLVRAA